MKKRVPLSDKTRLSRRDGSLIIDTKGGWLTQHGSFLLILMSARRADGDRPPLTGTAQTAR